MDWEHIQGNWKRITGKAKERWDRLSHEDLDVIAGRRDLFAGKIQQRYGVYVMENVASAE